MITLINPFTGLELVERESLLVDDGGNSFPIVHGIPRFVRGDNYANNFGMQWRLFPMTQIDRENDDFLISHERFFAETEWSPSDLDSKNILEVGSGAGRFSRVILHYTKANLYSVDYSGAVEVNMRNNAHIAPDRFNLFQADIYDLPFKKDSFDMVFCFGVLQHTPCIEGSIKSLVEKVKPGGEVVVDFYPLNGWWTKLHAKYLLRPILSRLDNVRLLNLIEKNINWLMTLSNIFSKMRLHFLSRFLPIVDLRTLPIGKLSHSQYREWAILDTFDMFSPVYDTPIKISTVEKIFKSNGLRVTFSGSVTYGTGLKAVVVRGIK